MQRFRRKSEVRKRKDREDGSSPPSPSTSQQPLLPEASDFRTSLILPHLTQRFALLRSEDGRLVTPSVMQERLKAQRQTGRLTAFEVDAVLAQYRLQSRYEEEQPSGLTVPFSTLRDGYTKRASSNGDENHTSHSRGSFATTDSHDYDSSYTPYTASSMGTTNPFPFSSYTNDFSTSTSGSPHASPLQTYRRTAGSNSLFGGRVAPLKVPKSSSMTSISSRRRASPPESQGNSDGEKHGENTSEDTGDLAGDEDATQEVEDTTEEIQEEPVPRLRLPKGEVPELSAASLNRISRVLDDIEQELSLEYLRLRNPPTVTEEEDSTNSTQGAEPLSPTSLMSDTEAIDPHFHQLASSNRRPSLANSLASSTMLAAAASGRTTPLVLNGGPPLGHPSDSSRSLSPTSNGRDGPTPVPTSAFDAASIISQADDTQSTSAADGHHDAYRTREASFDSSVGDPVSPSQSSIFPSRSHRERSGSAQSEEGGPFDLGYSSSRASGLSRSLSKATKASSMPYSPANGRRAYAATSASTDPSASFFNEANGSRSSFDSVGGSSYHGGRRDSGEDDPALRFPREESEGTLDLRAKEGGEEKEVVDDEAFLRVASMSMSRRPSDELLKELQAHSEGESNLELKDLVMIQESLVRRAAAAKLGDTPSTFSSRNSQRFSAEYGPGSDAQSGTMLGSPRSNYESAKMTPTTSQDTTTSEDVGSSPSDIDTPSTGQSDAFEFSHLVGSNDLRRASNPDEDDEEAEELKDMPLEITEDGFSPVLSPAFTPANLVSPNIVSPNLISPNLEPSPTLRVARNMPPRDRRATQSVLIRDVRNQANQATMALKKQGVASSPRTKSVSRSKSIRNTSISSPQLISAPENIPTVPISSPSFSSSSMSPHMEGDADARGSKGKGGISSRFKRMLKKQQSRDQLPQLNGDEITPFIDTEGEGSYPITPPQQDSSRFATPSDDTPGPHDTPTQDLRASAPFLSPTGVLSGALSAVEERSESGSPSLSTGSSPALPTLPSSASPENKRSIGRLVSRFRSIRRPSDASALDDSRSSASSPVPTLPTSPLADSTSTRSRRPSVDDTLAMGLGIATSPVQEPSRVAISYDISARRRPDALASTAPLVPGHRPAAADLNNLSISSTPLTGGRQNRHVNASSIDSMTKLWEAAEDLGMPEAQVRELVDLSYAQSPTTSSGHSSSERSGRRRSSSAASATQPPSSLNAKQHRRGGSEASVVSGRSHRRHNSTSSRAVQDRPSTPPPTSSHRRQASQEQMADAGPVPPIPPISTLPTNKLSIETDRSSRNNRLSVTTASSSLRPPISPGALSFRSDRSSAAYAGSVFDLYAYGEENEENEDEDHVDGLPMGEEPNSNESAPQEDQDAVWKVLNNLKQNRLSESSNGSFGFNSRHSSEADSMGLASPQHPTNGTTLATTAIDPFKLYVQHHRDSVSSDEMADGRAIVFRPPSSSSEEMPLQNSTPRLNAVTRGITPSVYVRDEKRLMGLEGGVADEEMGRFIIRSGRRSEDAGENERGLRLTVRD